MNFAELGGERGLFASIRFGGRFALTKAWLNVWGRIWAPIGYATRNSVWFEVGNKTLPWNPSAGMVWDALETQEFIHEFD